MLFSNLAPLQCREDEAELLSFLYHSSAETIGLCVLTLNGSWWCWQS